jgi:hypothetical protein
MNVKLQIKEMASQTAIPSKQYLGGYLPYAFTEHGISMLANILKTFPVFIFLPALASISTSV